MTAIVPDVDTLDALDFEITCDYDRCLQPAEWCLTSPQACTCCELLCWAHRADRLEWLDAWADWECDWCGADLGTGRGLDLVRIEPL